MTKTILGKLGVPEDTAPDELIDMIEQWEREYQLTTGDLADVERVVKMFNGDRKSIVDYYLRKIMADES